MGVKRSKEQAIQYALANPESTIVHKNLADFSKVIANNAQIYQGGAHGMCSTQKDDVNADLLAFITMAAGKQQ